MEMALTIFKNAIIWLTNSLENVRIRLVLDRDLSQEDIQLYQPRSQYEEMELAPPDWTKKPS